MKNKQGNAGFFFTLLFKELTFLSTVLNSQIRIRRQFFEFVSIIILLSVPIESLKYLFP